MRPNASLFSHQAGSMLIVSVFALTALAALGAALMQITWSQSDTTTREVLGTRAWLAANSGTEMAMAQLFPLNSTAADCSAVSTGTTFTADGLKGCSVTVSCKAEGAEPLLQYRVESKGQCGNGAHSVVRVQESWVRGL